MCYSICIESLTVLHVNRTCLRKAKHINCNCTIAGRIPQIMFKLLQKHFKRSLIFKEYIRL